MSKSLKIIIERFVEDVTTGKSESSSDNISVLLYDLYRAVLTGEIDNRICQFKIKKSSTDTSLLEKAIQSHPNSECLKYIIYELVCNIEQHAGTEFGYGFVSSAKESNTLTLAIADGGVSIYGSYVKNKKFIELVANSDVQALNLAQNGYSTKNLPNAENRGYGISTSSRLVVEGLHGEFAIISGNALFFRDKNGKQIVDLPEEFIWQGTIVIMNIPFDSEKVDIYKYIS